MLDGRVERELDGQADGRRLERRRSTSTVISRVGSSSTARSRRSPPRPATTTGTRPFLAALLRKMSPNRGEIDRREARLLDGPDRVLAGRPGAEVRPGDEDRRAGVLRLVEHEVAVVAPFREEALLEPGALDPLEPVARDDLVGVDVGAVERHRGAGDDADGVHQLASLGRDESRREGEVAGQRGGRGDRGRDEVGAAAAALAALEVAVAGRRAALAGGELVGVHGQAHRAAGVPPVEPGLGEDRGRGPPPRPRS